MASTTAPLPPHIKKVFHTLSKAYGANNEEQRCFVMVATKEGRSYAYAPGKTLREHIDLSAVKSLRTSLLSSLDGSSSSSVIESQGIQVAETPPLLNQVRLMWSREPPACADGYDEQLAQLLWLLPPDNDKNKA